MITVYLKSVKVVKFLSIAWIIKTYMILLWIISVLYFVIQLQLFKYYILKYMQFQLCIFSNSNKVNL